MTNTSIDILLNGTNNFNLIGKIKKISGEGLMTLEFSE
jgi:hypothetical protein